MDMWKSEGSWKQTLLKGTAPNVQVDKRVNGFAEVPLVLKEKEDEDVVLDSLIVAVHGDSLNPVPRGFRTKSNVGVPHVTGVADRVITEKIGFGLHSTACPFADLVDMHLAKNKRSKPAKRKVVVGLSLVLGNYLLQIP
ncbi:unnamed protein product [Lupinus luteus]|uniref:Uncharacterized protein n=1 Tax=Lupinus luteus TaxID=3873 RepID=A0AAV1Y1D3_LUPLU